MESKHPDAQIIENSIREIIRQFDNPDRPGMFETPGRYARAMIELLYKPDDLKITVFDGNGHDNMVVDTEIPFYSFCEHHLLPFFGVATVGYIPKSHCIGLSKLGRIVQYFAGSFQMQERLTDQIAKYIYEKIDPLGVGVIIKARHLCREMRGLKVQGAEMVTSSLLGTFREQPEVKAEFLRFLR